MKNTTELHREFDEMERNHGWLPEHKARIKDFIDRQRINDLKERIAEVEALEKEKHDNIENGQDFVYDSVTEEITIQPIKDISADQAECYNAALREILSRLQSDLTKLEEGI